MASAYMQNATGTHHLHISEDPVRSNPAPHQTPPCCIDDDLVDRKRNHIRVPLGQQITSTNRRVGKSIRRNNASFHSFGRRYTINFRDRISAAHSTHRRETPKHIYISEVHRAIDFEVNCSCANASSDMCGGCVHVLYMLSARSLHN